MSVRPPVLFIGPSLPRAEVEALLEVEVDIRPPVRRGDFDALPSDVDLVGVVDGVFFSDQAVSPREILGALRRGVRTLGSSSMGALRAAELDAFGMEGVGDVYRMYVCGEVESDADVALAFDPDTTRAMTEPMVNVIHMLRLATSAQVLDQATADRVLAVARGIYFFDRTYRALLARLRQTLTQSTVDRLEEFVADHAVEGDLKRADAIVAIHRLNQLALRTSSGRG